MQASYVDAAVFPDQHYANGLSDISSLESQAWKAEQTPSFISRYQSH